MYLHMTSAFDKHGNTYELVRMYACRCRTYKITKIVSTKSHSKNTHT